MQLKEFNICFPQFSALYFLQNGVALRSIVVNVWRAISNTTINQYQCRPLLRVIKAALLLYLGQIMYRINFVCPEIMVGNENNERFAGGGATAMHQSAAGENLIRY